MTDPAPLLEVVDVTRRYDGGGTEGPVVLRGVTLSVDPGASIAIVGPSGSGKSTLLNIIGALDTPTTGVVRLEGIDLAELSSDALAELRNRRLGFIFQSHHLLPQLTALENVLVPTLVTPGPAPVERGRALLEAVGLADRATHRPGQLSGGECQRVAVVRSLINEPALVLADEPTGSLDASAADDLGQLLCSLNETHGVTLIAVTHSMRLAERMGQTLELRDGSLSAAGAHA